MALILPFLVYSSVISLIGDDDPMDCNGHGTHVSGIVLGNALNANASQPFVGVAPGARMFIYKVFGCDGSTSQDLVIDALARAFADGVQVIQMSIGGANGWSEVMDSVIASRIASRGVFVSVAAGNDGGQGLFRASSPSTGKDVMAIASVDSSSVLGWDSLTAQNKTIVSSAEK